MKIYSKVMAAIVAGAMVFAMAGCSGGTDSSSETPADGGETEQTAEGGEEKGDKLIMATNATLPPAKCFSILLTLISTLSALKAEFSLVVTVAQPPFKPCYAC